MSVDGSNDLFKLICMQHANVCVCMCAYVSAMWV